MKRNRIRHGMLQQKEKCNVCGEHLYLTVLEERLWCKKCRKFKD